MGSDIKRNIGILITFILLGLAFLIGGPFLIAGFDAMKSGTNATCFTGFVTTVGAGPVLIVLAVIISVALGFLGLKIFGKSKD
jgi:hypothetical protein